MKIAKSCLKPFTFLDSHPGKGTFCVFEVLVILMLSLSASQASAQTLAAPGVCYASTGSADGGRLLTIDPTTGAGTLIGNIPAFGAFGGLAINSTGEMFATDAGGSSDLYRIDAATGAATLVGNTGISAADAIAFDANGVLFATQTNSIDKLYTINISSAVGTVVGTVGAAHEIAGLAFDPSDGVLYGSTGSGNDELYTINPTTGAASFVGSTGLGGSIPDIFFDQAGNLFGSKGGGGGSGSLGGGPVSNLISIDKVTGSGVVIGPIGFQAVSGLDCFFPSSSSVPTTGNWSLIILALALFILGVVVLTRWHKHSNEDTLA